MPDISHCLPAIYTIVNLGQKITQCYPSVRGWKLQMFQCCALREQLYMSFHDYSKRVNKTSTAARLHQVVAQRSTSICTYMYMYNECNMLLTVHFAFWPKPISPYKIRDFENSHNSCSRIVLYIFQIIVIVIVVFLF